MDLVSKSAGVWGTIGRFGLATNYAITGIAGKVLTVTENVTSEFAPGDKLLIDSGTGIGEVYTVVSAIWDVNHTDITVSETLGAVIVTDTLCFTKVPEVTDNVAVTHNIPGSTSTVIACDDLDLSGAIVNFTCSSASTIAGTIKPGTTYSFSFGTKLVGVKWTGMGDNDGFEITSEGCVIVHEAPLSAASMTLGDVTSHVFSTSAGGNIAFSGAIKVGNVTGSFVHGPDSDNLVQVTSAVSITVGTCSEMFSIYGQVDAPTINKGIALSDIREGVAGGTCAVPAAKNVKKGVAVDAGVGTYRRGIPCES